MKHGGNVWQGEKPSEWLDFSANLRPEGIPAWVKAALESAKAEARYYPDIEMRAAAQGIAAYAGTDEENVLPTAGGMAAIDLVLSLGGGRVITDRHTFGEYAERAAVYGREWVISGSVSEKKGDTRVICNPNNPTGALMKKEDVLAEHSRLKKLGAELVVDEAFIDYCPEDSVRGQVSEGLIVVGSLTKTLCVPGVRLGYVCADKKTLRRLRERALPWQLNAFAARVAAELPGHLDGIRQDAELNAGRREKFVRLLDALGAKTAPSRANFLLCDFGRDMTEAVKHLKTRRILVRECASFGLGNNYLRLAVKTGEENRLLAEELEKWLRS
ncbi:MAG: aminotransferase class I/II-fold pyridoxal phosphate-dependent enzyme [Clostridia bacterium]|nr:aminotransferase class I/II-fold pyridoxal phosphate-dependent enzyme [Clostridia bacterium]